MRHTTSLRFFGFISFCTIVGLAFIGCDGYTHINGIVKNRNGAPLPNVHVVLAHGGRSVEALSSNDGKFQLGMTHPPVNFKLTLSLTRDGYQPFNKAFQSRDHLSSVDVTLEELPEPTVGQVRKLRLKGLNALEARDLAELMCQQLPNAAAFPMKSFLSGDDVHDTLVLLSGFAQPCLVDHLADSTWMPDSRSEPLADFHAGDAALWILTDAGLDWDTVVPLLDQKKWNDVGIYEYFNWVNQGNHRKVVQQTVKVWLQQHPNCCGNETDFGDTEVAPVHKIAPQRLAEMQQAWLKLKPGMDESAARQILGTPDAVADPEHLDGVMDLNRFEKSAEFYCVENRTSQDGKFDFRRRDFLRDRYVIVFYSGNGKLARVFSNVRELPPIYPKSEKFWSAMIEASQIEMQKEGR